MNKIDINYESSIRYLRTIRCKKFGSGGKDNQFTLRILNPRKKVVAVVKLFHKIHKLLPGLPGYIPKRFEYILILKKITLKIICFLQDLDERNKS